MDKEKLKRIIKFDGMNDKFADIYNATHQETEYQKRKKSLDNGKTIF